MALETGTYITDLTITNPDGADDKTTADDHLRLLKRCIKNSFSGIVGPVTVSQSQLNLLAGLTTTVQDELDTKIDASVTHLSNTVWTISPSEQSTAPTITSKTLINVRSRAASIGHTVYHGGQYTNTATAAHLAILSTPETSASGSVTMKHQITVWNPYTATLNLYIAIKAWD